MPSVCHVESLCLLTTQCVNRCMVSCTLEKFFIPLVDSTRV